MVNRQIKMTFYNELSLSWFYFSFYNFTISHFTMNLFWFYFSEIGMFSSLTLSLFLSLTYWMRGGQALENGLARTPPMGWMAWQRYRCNVDCDNYPEDCIR